MKTKNLLNIKYSNIKKNGNAKIIERTRILKYFLFGKYSKKDRFKNFFIKIIGTKYPRYTVKIVEYTAPYIPYIGIKKIFKTKFMIKLKMEINKTQFCFPTAFSMAIKLTTDKKKIQQYN